MQTEPSIIVLLGITGDLSRRKLLPALHQLHEDGYLDPNTIILGSSRRKVEIKDILADSHIKGAISDGFAKRLRITQFNPDDEVSHQALKAELENIEKEQGIIMQRVFYLSIPPESLVEVVATMGKTQLANSRTKIMIEKPYGHNIDSAINLTKQLEKVFDESQIFRIDHYAAKEMVQNITVFRQQNHLFNQLFNNNYIASIYIRAHESIDIAGRADFYEQSGALRDLIQSHLLQVLADTAMRLPDQPDATDQEFHSNRLAFLNSLVAPTKETVGQQAVRGQYQGYRDEIDNQLSNTETFAAIELKSIDPDWRNVAFILETGKALPEKLSDVTITFKATELTDKAAELRFSIDPEHGISMTTHVKQPGFNGQSNPQVMKLSIEDAFTEERLPEAYERIFFDALRGDQTLFVSAGEAIRCWEIVQPILDVWHSNGDGLINYKKGSHGPSLKKLA